MGMLNCFYHLSYHYFNFYHHHFTNSLQWISWMISWNHLALDEDAYLSSGMLLYLWLICYVSTPFCSDRVSQDGFWSIAKFSFSWCWSCELIFILIKPSAAWCVTRWLGHNVIVCPFAAAKLNWAGKTQSPVVRLPCWHKSFFCIHQ